MARLPTPIRVDNLRFTGNTRLQFTLKWASNDPYAEKIDHIRLRFMMTNLLDLGTGIDADVVKAIMEAWNDITPLTGPGLSAADTEVVPTAAPAWDMNLLTLHRIDYRSAKIVLPASDNGAMTNDNIHEEVFGAAAPLVDDDAFQQRFVRLIAQARTPD